MVGKQRGRLMAPRISYKPISFSPHMIRAILNGQKTQTRRLQNPQMSRYFQGDLLWVREHYYQFGHWEPVPGQVTKKERKQKWKFIPDRPDVLFDQPKNCRLGRHHKDSFTQAWHKRLGRFMPQSASRLTLRITDVRSQRLQDITEEDAIAEGLSRLSKDGGRLWKYGIPDKDGLPGADDYGWPWQDWSADPRLAFAHLWTSIHGPDSWDQNPWVVAILFKTEKILDDFPEGLRVREYPHDQTNQK